MIKKNILYLFLIINLNAIGQDKFEITHGPYLQFLDTDGVSIVWTTNRNAISWVELAPDDNTHFYQKERTRYYAAEYGIKDIGMIHSVRIDNLKPATKYRYRVYSQEVLNHEWVTVTYGRVAASDVYRQKPLMFTTRDNSRDEFSFLVINDIHGRNDLLENLMNKGDVANSDFVFFNGDMVNHLTTEEKMFEDFMDTSIRLFAKGKPFYYSKGNHETRGHFAHNFPKYFASPERKLFYTIKQGPVTFIVLDCGEDKPDSDMEYSGIAAFDQYRDVQKAWLENIIQTEEIKEAAIKIVIIHMPPFGGWHGEEEVAAKFIPVLDKAGVDIMFCGHLHRHIKKEAGELASFPIISNSNSNVIKATIKGNIMNIKIISESGAVVDEFSIKG